VTGRIGDILVARGAATAAQVEVAARTARARGGRIGSALLDQGVAEAAIAAAIAGRHGLPGVDLSRSVIPTDVLPLVPPQVAQADLILPLSGDGGRLHLAMANPAADRIVAEVRFVTGRDVSVYAAVQSALERAISGAYDALAAGAPVWAGAAAETRRPHLAAVHAVDDAGEPPLLEPVPIDDLDVEVAAVTEEEVVFTLRGDGRRLVLVVDDEPEIRTLVGRTLQARGYAVETAADGEEAVAKAEAFVPDVVLLDAMLPKLHGFEACRRMKASPRTRRVPVVMMTAIYRGWRFAQDARDTYGAEDYVEKPFRLDDLLRRMEAVLDAQASRGDPPSGPAEAVSRGRALLVAGQVREAVAALAAAAQEDPWWPEAQYHLARALRAAGDQFRAMSAFERCAELRPDHLPSLRALAGLYAERGFRKKAQETLARAVAAARDPDARAQLQADLAALG
jgi:DNA-binding response OmpR family regulator